MHHFILWFVKISVEVEPDNSMLLAFWETYDLNYVQDGQAMSIKELPSNQNVEMRMTGTYQRREIGWIKIRKRKIWQ